MIDDDFSPLVFPTRTGDPVGTGLENRMIGSVGGPDGIRTKVITLPDGSSVRMKTRAGMPEFIHTKAPQVEDTPRYVWAYSYASIVKASEDFSSIYFSGDAAYGYRRAYSTMGGGAKTLRYGLSDGILPVMEGAFCLDAVAGGYWYNGTDVVAWQRKSYMPTTFSGTSGGAYCDGYYGVGLFSGKIRLNHGEAFDVNGVDAGVYVRQPTPANQASIEASITGSVCQVCCACALRRVAADGTQVSVVRVLLKSVYPDVTTHMLVRDYIDGVQVSELQVPYGVRFENYANGAREYVSTSGWSMDGRKVVLSWTQGQGEQTVFTVLDVAEDGLSFSTEGVPLGPVREAYRVALSSSGATTHPEPPDDYTVTSKKRRDLTAEIVSDAVDCLAVGFSSSGELCAVFSQVTRVTSATAWAQEDSAASTVVAGTATTYTRNLTADSYIDTMTDVRAELSVWRGSSQIFSRKTQRLMPRSLSPRTTTEFQHSVSTSSSSSFESDYRRKTQVNVYSANENDIDINYSLKLSTQVPWMSDAQIQSNTAITYTSDGYAEYGDFLVSALLTWQLSHVLCSQTQDFCDFGSGVMLLRVAPVTAEYTSFNTVETVSSYTYSGSDPFSFTPASYDFFTEESVISERKDLIEKADDTPQQHLLFIDFTEVSARKVAATPGQSAWCPVKKELLHFYSSTDYSGIPGYTSRLLGALHTSAGWSDVYASPSEPTPMAMQVWTLMHPTPFGIEPT